MDSFRKLDGLKPSSFHVPESDANWDRSTRSNTSGMALLE
jgi:hypothetical protein